MGTDTHNSPDEAAHYETLLVETRGRVRLLTLNRPDKLNAWTYRMGAELADAVLEADADEAIGAVVVTGAGRGFCAGADMSDVFDAQLNGERDRDTGSPERTARTERTDPGRWIDIVRTTKPIVAAVNGAAVGVGLTMILPFDRIVAADDAKLSLRFAKMGLVPELASSHFVPARVGFGAANDLMLSARFVSGREAAELGLADESVPGDQLLDRALTVAGEYAENPARQLRWIKELLTANTHDADTSAVQARELAYLERAYASPEHAAAVAAFLSKN